MRIELLDKRPGGARRGAAALLATLLAALSLVIALGSEDAPAQSVEQLDDAIGELEGNQAEQGDVEAAIEQQNAEIDQLIAQEAELRASEAAVQSDLDAAQARLAEAAAALRAERAHLELIKERLAGAKVSLRTLLVDMYKSNDPDVLDVVMSAASWDDVLSYTEYMNRVEDHQDAVIVRVTTLSDDVEATVARLAADKDEIEAQRDAIADHRDELANARSELEAQHADLVAAREEREAALDSLQDREQNLQNQVSPGASPPGGATATIGPDGRAIAPADAPLAVKAAIEAANQIVDAPYSWGGGHGSFESSGYDCSGAISYALHGAGLLDTPLDSTGFTTWGEPGGGSWITVYANSGHAFAVIAGLRWDTSGDASGTGPSWYTEMRSSAGYVVRHPSGL